MVVPITGESTDMLNVNVSIFNVWYYIFHNCLSKVWRAFESDWESQVLVFTKWCYNSTEVLTFLVKLKCIVLHTNIKFCETLVPRALAQNVRDYRQWVLLATSTLFSWHELLIQCTLPSFFGVMKEGEAHSLSCCGAKTPILIRWSSTILKVFKWIQGTG